MENTVFINETFKLMKVGNGKLYTNYCDFLINGSMKWKTMFSSMSLSH